MESYFPLFRPIRAFAWGLGTMNAIAEDITIVKELKIEHAEAPVGGKDVHILRLEGYVDAHTFAEFEEELTRLTDKENQFNLLLDLEKLTYINSTGLGLLMATFRQVRQHNGDLVIAKMSDKITNIFNLLGFSRLIHTYPSEQEALARFAPSEAPA